MRRYWCPNCANEVHFANSVCIKCLHSLGYLIEHDSFVAAQAGVGWAAAGLRNCANHDLIGCNWLVAQTDTSPFCASCKHTLVIPDLAFSQNVDHWASLERAKRLLFYALHKFHLPVEERQISASATWLRFEFKADQLSSNGQPTSVMTGHQSGVITINIAEADDAVREHHRVSMGEPYRTLLGHFRHEVGHYYWDRLVNDNGRSDSFRTMFGDERADYSQALQQHYQFGAPPGWEQRFVSSYASAHPWEDFAETWAHYLHIVDGLETAQSHGIGQTATSHNNPYSAADCNQLIADWIPLTIAMNAMNRSMGNQDFYPFVMSEVISTKLEFVHSLIHPQPL